MAFIPNSEAERQEMLNAIGIGAFEDLLDIPESLRFQGELKLPEPLSEMEVTAHMDALSRENKNSSDNVCFLGGGAYDHYIPAAVKHILLRSEFYTAYTPYQPEVAQGTLQAIYEYQTMICELTGMAVANASMYDGGSALAEACLLAAGHKRRNKIVVCGTLHPNYLQIIRTYCSGRGIEVVTVPRKGGVTDMNALEAAADNDTAAVVVQHPNYLGALEDVDAVSQIATSNDALLISSNDPISLALLKPPGEYGVDIATGEGQSLGNSMSLGGPYLGIFAATKELVRKIPGRIVGQSVDQNGQRGFVLTLQTREQHIRREKATSNICTNQGLNALAATVYMSLMGKDGLPHIANLALQKSHYLAAKIAEIDGFGLKFETHFFKEFVVRSEKPVEQVLDYLKSRNVFGGVPLLRYDHELSDSFLVAVTEKRTKAELDYFVNCLKEL